MKKMILFITALLVGYVHNTHTISTVYGISFFSQRSQTTNAARDIVGTHNYRYAIEHDRYPSYVNIAPTYNQSLRSERMAQVLFGTNELVVAGSEIPNRGPCSLVADYFGLSPKFQSNVRFRPKMQSFTLPLRAHVNLPKNFYLEIQVPFVWTQWKLDIEEQIINKSQDPFAEGCVAPQEVIPPFCSFKNALKGKQRYGNVEALRFGRVDGSQSDSTIANIDINLGYNIYFDSGGHVGIGLHVATPTGTRPQSNFLFEPIAGNGKHTELGFFFDAHSTVWEYDPWQHFGIVTRINIAHLFNAEQRRSFDLDTNGFASRYIIAKEFDKDGMFTGTLFPLINRTTLLCDVDIGVQGDVVIMGEYAYQGFIFDFGYNAWFRSKERIELKQTICPQTIGLKGQVKAFVDGAPSNITQNNATIFGNENNNQEAIPNDPSPEFVRQVAINTSSAASPFVFTHKLFIYLGNSWYTPDCSHAPFIGIGGEIEFEGFNENNTPISTKNTMSQWGIYGKFGTMW